MGYTSCLDLFFTVSRQTPVARLPLTGEQKSVSAGVQIFVVLVVYRDSLIVFRCLAAGQSL